MKILLHYNEYKIINLWYPTYVNQFFNFPYNYKNRVLACFQTRAKGRICRARQGAAYEQKANGVLSKGSARVKRKWRCQNRSVVERKNCVFVAMDEVSVLKEQLTRSARKRGVKRAAEEICNISSNYCSCRAARGPPIEKLAWQMATKSNNISIQCLSKERYAIIVNRKPLSG